MNDWPEDAAVQVGCGGCPEKVQTGCSAWLAGPWSNAPRPEVEGPLSCSANVPVTLQLCTLSPVSTVNVGVTYRLLLMLAIVWPFMTNASCLIVDCGSLELMTVGAGVTPLTGA